MTSLAVVLVAASAITADPRVEDPQFEMALERIKIFEPFVGEWFWDEFTAPRHYPDLEMKRGDKVKRLWLFRMDLVKSIVVSEVVLEKPSGERFVVASVCPETGLGLVSGRNLMGGQGRSSSAV